MHHFLFDPYPPKRRRPAPPVDIKTAIADAADRITATRVVRQMQREGRVSISGKMAALTERAKDFTAATETVLDGITEKINKAESRRNAAEQKHHAYYDTIIAGVDESVDVIDRLSNGPLPQGGEG